MRRLLTLPVLAVLLAGAASAAPITLGIHGGSSIPDLRDNGGNELSSGWSSRLAPAYGVSVELSAAGPWTLLAEVNVSGQGARRTGLQPLNDPTSLGFPAGTPAYASFKNEEKLTYVEIPVMARYHLPAPFRPTLAAGPYVGFLTSAKNVTSGTSSVWLDRAQTILATPPVSFDATTDTKSDLRSFNWGVQAGFGAALPYGRGAITLDVRGGLGLTNIQKDSANGKNATGALTVALGYALPVGL
jgi:hypothetical protein